MKLEWKTRNDRRKAKITEFEQQMQELIRMRTQGLLTDEEFVRAKGQVKERQSALATPLPKERFDRERIRADIEIITRPLTELKATWSSIPVRVQKRFKQMLVPSGFVVGGIRTAEIGHIFRVFEGFSEENTSLVPLTGESLNRLYQAIQAFAELFRSVEEEKQAA